MRKSLVISALNQAIGRTKAGEGLLVHSDRGVQYASHAYQEVLKKNGYKCSMSRRGNCWDNAPMESFWGKLKQEWLYGNRFRTRDEAKAAIYLVQYNAYAPCQSPAEGICLRSKG